MTSQKANKIVQMLTMNIEIMINIEQVKEFNFLGLVIDTHLNWKRNTEKISNAYSKKIGIYISQQIKSFL